ncbi:MAG: hypothetical protein COT81_03300 [Candidatus Buchananbacteria bacterium CG10_big_fil_rev_8_21_14_0_10_42_9]|uniref:Amino acid permease n=1 Tax=Candidatus Buchananbacteria bacterium CG10_big_fil_rev_8_21_14_0_10_42_9 TaxID=1974526 RepID=A0A2H0W184_9BACT|nr:MAG: hypothetical protein COT81_03300 [Candidatus Buchananbacteria bacterium CG10_big_fil_rev_8_21_14_0_10_42_9]
MIKPKLVDKPNHIDQELGYWQAVAILVGTVIGAGILGIPYVVSKTGLVLGLVIIVIIFLALTSKSLLLAEVTLRTRASYQLPGYAGAYLGPWAKWLYTFVQVSASYGAIIAYIVGVGTILSEIIGGPTYQLLNLTINPTIYWGVAFAALGGMVVYAGLILLRKIELWLTIFLALIVIILAVIGWNGIEKQLIAKFDYAYLFLAYGTVFFAFSGASAIPQMRRVLKGQENKLASAIVTAKLIIFVIYILFTVTVLSITGLHTTEIATVGLDGTFGLLMFYLANILALFTISTSFFSLGLALKNVYHLDYKIRNSYAWLFTMVPPTILFLMGLNDFVGILNFIGAVGGGILGVLIILIFWQAKKKGNRNPEFSLPELKPLGWILIVMFLVGILYTLVHPT